MTDVRAYDPFAPDVIADPYPAYAWLRSEAPVHYVAQHDVWVVSGYDDVQRVPSTPTSFATWRSRCLSSS
nr:cytochrome P450 [Actinomycetota bacterium]